MPTITDEERDTILAALRVFQLWRGSRSIDTDAIEEIATNGGEHFPLTVKQVDELCERLNT
jgi:hypothetical protein